MSIVLWMDLVIIAAIVPQYSTDIPVNAFSMIKLTTLLHLVSV